MAKEKKTLRIDDILRYAGWLDAMRDATAGRQGDFSRELSESYEAAESAIYEMVATLTNTSKIDVMEHAIAINPYLPYPKN